MSKELKDYTVFELYKELCSRDHVEVVLWTDDDIAESLMANEIKVSEGNIQKIWDLLGHWLRDSSIQKGWDAIDEAVCETRDRGELAA